jgi:ABC-type polysaccharide/polyol phosphate transport system ATPase subunit
MSSAQALVLSAVSKVFRIPHEQRSTVRENLVRLFRRVEYEELRAVDEVSLTVAPGEFVGVIGKNGSGKTTLLKLISGIYPPTRGKITVSGTISPFLELGVGFNAELTARDNILLSGSVMGIPRSSLLERFRHIIAFAELEKFVDTKLKNFSSGMWVRLALSVAIEVEADMYLLDEVLAVGDQGFQRKCFDVFRGLKSQGKTVLYVSHDLETVREFCTRCVYMADGRVRAEGAPQDVIQRYVADVG